MIFERFATEGCQSYLVGCEETGAAALIDPEMSQIDHYIATAARHGLRLRYAVDTHTHADHFSATAQLAARLDIPVAMHRASPRRSLTWPSATARCSRSASGGCRCCIRRGTRPTRCA